MSQLAAMMNAALEEERNAPAADAEAAPSETADGAASPGAEGTDVSTPSASSSEGAPSSPAVKDAPKEPATKAPEADAEKQKAAAAREAAQFAALARKKDENVRAEQALSAREQALSAREAAIAAREGEAHRILDDPELMFKHIEQRHGVKDVDQLRALAAGTWKKPEPELPPEKRPLTKADLDAERARWQQEQVRGNVERDFNALFDAPDSKFEAANLLYTQAERIAHGHAIANELTRRGIAFKLDEIADAVDERARQDPRYAKIQAKMTPTAPAKGAPAAAANASSNGRQPSQAATIPNDAATERSSANGAPRLTHKERLQRLMRG